MAKANHDSTIPPRIDPKNLPAKVFAVKVAGDCLAPSAPDGSFLLVQRDELPAAGELACIYFKNLVANAQGKPLQGVVKRFPFSLPKGIKFPLTKAWERKLAKSGGPTIYVESFNPPLSHAVDLRKVLGIFRAIIPPASTVIVREDTGQIDLKLSQDEMRRVLRRPTRRGPEPNAVILHQSA